MNKVITSRVFISIVVVPLGGIALQHNESVFCLFVLVGSKNVPSHDLKLQQS
jgi:hypothetical protein